MLLWQKPLLLVLPAVLAACASSQQSLPFAPAAAERGIQIVRALPEALPSHLSKVPETQYLLVFAGSTALALLDNLNPLPISITDPIAGAYQDQEAGRLKGRYASVDPFVIATERMQGSPLLTGRADALRTMPLVYMVEDSDDNFRPTLVLRAEDGGWMGRYLYHMPGAYAVSQVKAAAPEMLAGLRRELQQGADVLRGLMERDARGTLKGDGRRVAYGSYHIVGSRVGGMVPASMMTFPDAEVLEEGPEHVVLRSGGDPKSNAREGSLAFGVHYFRKDQLHTFKPMPAK